MRIDIPLEQVLQTDIGLIFNKKRSRFEVRINGQKIEQNVCEFLLTSSFLLSQDPEEYLMSTDSCYDSVKIPLTMDGKSFTADVCAFIRMREAYGRQLYNLKLEDLLLHRGIRFAN